MGIQSISSHPLRQASSPPQLGPTCRDAALFSDRPRVVHRRVYFSIRRVTPRIPRFYGHPINLIAPAQASFTTTSVGSHVERCCSILRSTKSRISPSILQYTKSNTQDSTCLWASNKTHRARSGKLHRPEFHVFVGHKSHRSKTCHRSR